MSRVAVTGVGILCALGRGTREVWAALAEGRRAFAPPTLFAAEGVARAPVAEASEKGVARGRESRLDRMLRAAAGEALEGAGLGAGRTLAGFGVSLGTSNGGMLEAESWFEEEVAAGGAGRRRASAARVLRLPASVATDALAASTGARGPRLTNTTACSSSAGSIAAAASIVRAGEAEGMLAGGGDPLCRLTYGGFGALRLMDPEGCRPFDADRRGLTLGEGAGILVLEAWEAAARRGAKPLAEILEHGASCDAHHMTACHPEGRGMESAMREALGRSGVEPPAVGYVNAHGTATPVNDAAEGAAIARVFGGREGPPVSSTKSMYGHLLGGSGAVEAVTCVLALRHGVLPATVGGGKPDEAIAVNVLRGRAARAPIALAASNSFGFGGGNVVLLFASAEGRA